MDKSNLILTQFARMQHEGCTTLRAVTACIFNHGIEPTCAALGLPKPRIRSIFFRTDCWARCEKAATQMLHGKTTKF